MRWIMKKPSLTTQIGIALLLAVLTGVLLRNQADFVNGYIKPIGIIFLNLLKFIVVPLVLFSIMAGILSMNDISKVGKIGIRAVLYFMVTTLLAVTLGLVVPSLMKGFHPLIRISPEVMAACCGIDLTMSQYLAIAFASTVASIGTPGIPGGSLALMAMVFASAGIPVECVAVAAGIDRIIDMGRTVMSVTGDASCAAVMQRRVGGKL